MSDRFVPSVAPLSRADIEKDAIRIIRNHFPNLLEAPGPFPVCKFFEMIEELYGLDPAVKELPDGIEGITWPDGRVILSETTCRGALNGNGRDRFTVVHEIYHGIKHRHQIKSRLEHTGRLVLHRRPSIPAYMDPEWQANVFASALLMPATMVEMVVARAILVFADAAVSHEFQVSMQAAQIRMKQLKLGLYA